MKNIMRFPFARRAFLAIFAILITLPSQSGALAAEKESARYLLPRPPLSEEMSPCSKCHDKLAVNTKKRALEKNHTDIALAHMTEDRWCMDCHSSKKIDMLTLANGEFVSFDDSYKLCLQCHGSNKKDWEIGLHGKTSGEWNGTKLYRHCAHCHDAHQPEFKSLEPFPPPLRPSEIKVKGS